jgi:hypothetical protein
MSNIRAATVAEAKRSSGEWVFVDLGFASNAKTCGMLIDEGEACTLSFSELKSRIASICSTGSAPLNLLLEAPLSVAFGPTGNPTGRSVESRNGQIRYWYLGLGCSVLVAATYLLRLVHDLPPKREIRLFEGLVSFKPKGAPSSHTRDVIELRALAWGLNAFPGRIVAPEELALDEGDHLMSAFRVSGMDFGVPPVIAVGC